MSEPTVTDAVGNPIFAAGGFPVVLPPEIEPHSRVQVLGSIAVGGNDGDGIVVVGSMANGRVEWARQPWEESREEPEPKEKQESPAFVWVLREAHHFEDVPAPNQVLGIFLGKEDAREESRRITRSRPYSWPNRAWEIDNQGSESRYVDRDITHHLERHDLQGVVSTDLLAFALSILQGDPVACDAVRDILKL